MTLDNFADNQPERAEKANSSALALFRDSALYSLHQSALGLAQTLGLENLLLSGVDIYGFNLEVSGCTNRRGGALSDLRETLRETGLSAWDVWRYSQFVGLTPTERLGLDSPAELQAHYKRVEELRRAPD